MTCDELINHIWLDFRIVLSCYCILFGLYGLREASKPLNRSIFINHADAELYTGLSFAGVVLGCLMAFTVVIDLIR